MVAPFWANNNHEGACEKIVQESVANWKREDEVIDDITCVILLLKVPEVNLIQDEINNYES